MKSLQFKSGPVQLQTTFPEEAGFFVGVGFTFTATFGFDVAVSFCVGATVLVGVSIDTRVADATTGGGSVRLGMDCLV